MKRLLFILLLLSGGAYYANQAALIPGWAPLPLPEWVPSWARVGPQMAGSNGGRRGGGQGRFGGGRFGQGGDDGPVPVVVAEAKYDDVPITLDAVGTVQALNTVTVRTQVDGRLMELDFQDGQDVKKGDVLALIDPATYQAQYDQAVAKKAQDEATLANARNDLIRYQKLAMTEAGSKQQADTQKALVAQLEAQVQGDQAAIDNTKATLAYTIIKAPIDGRTGIRLVDQGNILHASDVNGIVVITQIKPISVIFNLPQQQLRPVNAAMAKGAVAVNALEADNTTVIDKGTIEVIDNEVDQTTGTIKFKANFPNANLQLWPGQFVNVRAFVDMLKHAVVVPTAAVQRGPNGAYVFVLNDNSTVSMRNVTAGRQNETEAVISSGLEPPERVVTTGFSRLNDGTKVSIATADANAAAPAPPQPPPSQRRRRNGGGDAPGGPPPSGGAPANAATGSPQPSSDSPSAAGGSASQGAGASPTPPAGAPTGPGTGVQDRQGEAGVGQRRSRWQRQQGGPGGPAPPAPSASAAPAR
jgi:membrane fusion protein, multidrug efflux system